MCSLLTTKQKHIYPVKPFQNPLEQGQLEMTIVSQIFAQLSSPVMLVSIWVADNSPLESLSGPSLLIHYIPIHKAFIECLVTHYKANEIMAAKWIIIFYY